METNSTHLENFSREELKTATNILQSIIRDGYPDGLGRESIMLHLDPRNGHVFLMDEDYRACRLNGVGALEMVELCQKCGRDELISEGNLKEVILEDGYNTVEIQCASCS